MIEKYTSKQLTYSGDMLRAYTGISNDTYGRRTSFGLPWDDFDRAILWIPLDTIEKSREELGLEEFPTWSWTTQRGSVYFLELYGAVFSVAQWWRPIIENQPPHVQARYEPVRAIAEAKNRVTPRYCDIDYLEALAWLHGCIRTPAPESLKIDWNAIDYRARLEQMWPGESLSYWRDAFQSYKELDPSKIISADGCDLSTCLVVHTQRTKLLLDLETPQINREQDVSVAMRRLLLHLPNMKLADEIDLEQSTLERVDNIENLLSLDFIALSLSDMQ